MEYTAYCEYVESDGVRLHTTVCLPDKNGRFPVILCRSPYVDDMQEMNDSEIQAKMLEMNKRWLDSDYAVVNQHCRGRGKSDGDCIPYIFEREDGLCLQNWVRNQYFYNGEIYLWGGSYTSSVHYVTAPFADDIKGAVLEIQDCERYNCNFRNGFYKMGLHGQWYPGMYKRKSIPQKAYVTEAFNMLPLMAFSETVFGEKAEDFDEILKHPDKNDEFWTTRFGGGEAHNAVKSANIPILLVTGFYDIYTGGIFDMWNTMDESTKKQSALVVNPYAHGGVSDDQPIDFINGSISEQFGDYPVRWMNYVRGKEKAPFEIGMVTYYELFGYRWKCDDFKTPEKFLDINLGEGERTYRYNPYAPASFKGGLSTNFGGAAYQDKPNSRYDILSFYSEPFEEDIFVKGKMSARLCVKSSCEDTCFYIRLSLAKKDGDFGLRDDINSVARFSPDYVPGNEVTMDFSFDEHAFVVHKGEKIRIDISSSAFPFYVRHTNTKGLASEQKNAKVADNTVICDKSYIRIFFEC